MQKIIECSHEARQEEEEEDKKRRINQRNAHTNKTKHTERKEKTRQDETTGLKNGE